MCELFVGLMMSVMFKWCFLFVVDVYMCVLIFGSFFGEVLFV